MKKIKTPPRILSFLLAQTFSERERQDLLGDHEECYSEIYLSKGFLAACLWYAFQIAVSAPRSMRDSVKWRWVMIQNYIKIAMRNMLRQKEYPLINMAGFSIAIAVFILIALYIQYELSFDRHYENADRMYRVVRSSSTFTPAPLAPSLREKYPEVEAVTRIMQHEKVLVTRNEAHFLENTFHWAGPETFSVFSLSFISGNPKTALQTPRSIVISEKTAHKYFGDENPMGQSLTVLGQIEFTVTGVFREMPAHSHFTMHLIAPYEDWFKIKEWNISQWGGNFSYTYFLLRQGADASPLEEKIQTDIGIPLLELYGRKKPFVKEFYLQPVTEIHLHSHRKQEISVNSDIKTIYVFSAVAALILFIACINYMNLSTARSMGRSREVGIRKVMGAQRKQIAAQFLGESLTIAILSFFLGGIMALLALPAFSRLVEMPLTLNDPWFILWLFAVMIAAGLFAGSYPAFIISSRKPIASLRGTMTHSLQGRTLRNSLVIFQITVSILLFISTLTIGKQLRFMRNVDAGYAKEQIITMDIHNPVLQKNIDAIRRNLLANPRIEAVSTSACLPNNIHTYMSRYLNRKEPNKKITIFYNDIDYDFIDLYKIPMAQGRNFSREFPSDEKGAFLVNEAAVREAGWNSPIGMDFTHWNGRKGKIVGVIKDFHLHSLHSPIDPLYLHLKNNDCSKLSIRVKPMNIAGTLDYVEKTIHTFLPGFPFEYAFFDELFNRAYRTEERMVRIFSAFSFLAIFIASLGLLGLTAFMAEKRTKEIGIRKVLGASVPSITLLLSGKLLKLIVFGNLAAWPAAYLIMHRWLNHFAYRTGMTLWVFVLSCLAVTGSALIILSVQTVKAALSNPVESLRNE